ncbi:MAG: spore coat protein CotJB [Clostridiales bacterium]|jgi:spore coat protein JB|nr:spore coat protein CotJB [Clostridiales bacterium]
MIVSRTALQNELRELEFTLKDLNLYLDTHPTDLSALTEYNTTSNKRDVAKTHYEKLYGLMEIGSNEEQPRWDWISTAWPWEERANEVDTGSSETCRIGAADGRTAGEVGDMAGKGIYAEAVLEGVEL